MQKMKSFPLWVLVFVVLSLYVNLVPALLQQDSLLQWLGYWLSFFGLTFLVARYVLRLQGLQSLGMPLHKGWLRNLSLGFLVGVGVYALKYLACYGVGMFEIAGTTDASFIYVLVGQALVAMFFSSAINDVLIRGYTLAFLRKKRLMSWYVLVATALYILDDSWKEGFSLENIIFSATLGFTLAYTVLRTGTIWLSVGLHWGGNVMYRMLYGFSGQGIWKLENMAEGPLFEYISLAVTALLFPVVYMLLKSRLLKTDEVTKVQETVPAANMA